MQYTNEFDLPQPIVDAIVEDDYNRGECNISVTQLWKPPRIVRLENLHGSELRSDIIDNIWSLLGKAVHVILERAEREAITEKRLFIHREGWTISGKFDRLVLHQGKLSDYKVTSAWSVAKDVRETDWEEQLNTYAHILREHNIEVKKLEVVAILRDWRKREAQSSPEYPKKQVEIVPLRLWTKDEAEAKICSRIHLHQNAASSLPECTDSDRWKRGGSFAVLKEGRKRAVRVFDNFVDAEHWRVTQNDCGKMSVESRPPQFIRCESYCVVAPFCSQWKNEPHNPASNHAEMMKGLD